jgi:protein-disulfide isomerase
MARKRKRSNRQTSSSQANTEQASTTDAESASSSEAPTEAAVSQTRRQRRQEQTKRQKAARTAAADKSKGFRPWILPGIAGIAVIAIVLVGLVTLNSDDGNSVAAANVPSPSLGERTAQVVIHEYGDYQCPFCGVFARSIKPEIQERFIDTGIARLVWHDFAWHGQESQTAANAARCAGDQGQFWEMHDMLFERFSGENNGTFANENLKRYGGILGLEPEAFDSCVDGNTYRDAIAADMNRVRRLGLNGTPSFMVGDRRIVGAQPVEVFEQAILAELQAAG